MPVEQRLFVVFPLEHRAFNKDIHAYTHMYRNFTAHKPTFENEVKRTTRPINQSQTFARYYENRPSHWSISNDK